jgi:PAS domain-containing protein
MYGAIDRIGSGEVGSLLDRYSDRFGHELDREIIVMRKAEQDARREAVPTVELLSAPEPEVDDEPVEVDEELSTWLTEVEDLLRPLQRAYKTAESKAEKKRLAPALKVLISERKTLLAVIAGDAEEDVLDDLPERPDMPELEITEAQEAEEEATESEDEFAAFFEIINQLLGEMPEDWVNKFLESKGFKLFQKVGSDPAGSDVKSRKRFFKMINSELGDMPEDMLDAFVNSPEFQLYQTIGEIYGA